MAVQHHRARDEELREMARYFYALKDILRLYPFICARYECLAWSKSGAPAGRSIVP